MGVKNILITLNIGNYGINATQFDLLLCVVVKGMNSVLILINKLKSEHSLRDVYEKGHS